MSLPSTPQVNTAETMKPDTLRAIVYGRPGHGKTTLAAGWFPQTTLIIDLEGGTRHLPGKHFVAKPKTYGEFMVLVNELVAGQHDFKTVVVDTIDNLVRLADSEAGQRGGKVAAGLVEFGKGLADRDGTVLRDIRKLLSTELGVILVAHPTVVTEDVEGREVERVYPRIDPNDRIRQEVMGLVDYVLAVQRKSDGKHVLVTGGSRTIETKRRVPLPDELPADAKQLRDAVVAGVAQINAPTNTKEQSA